MRLRFTLPLFVLFALLGSLPSQVHAQCSATPWINAIHYDNVGGDVMEFVEIAGPAGLDLGEYQLAFYNGSNGTAYKFGILSGTIDDEQNGGGALSFNVPDIQNGDPDGVALYELATNTVIQFLSYEGAFTATNGVANGMMSSDIGVSEPGTTPVGSSLQLIGAGCNYDDFTWTGPVAGSPGSLNAGQTYVLPNAAPTSTCADPILVFDNNQPPPNTPSGGFGPIPASGIIQLSLGFPGGTSAMIDLNCLMDDNDPIGELSIRLQSSTVLPGPDYILENVYDIQDSDGAIALGLITIRLVAPANQPPSAGTARVGVELPTQGGAACPAATTVLDPAGNPLMAGATLAVDDVLSIAGIGVPVPTAAEVTDDNDPPGSLIVNVDDVTITSGPCTTMVSITYTVEDSQGATSAPRTDEVLVIDNTPPTVTCAEFSRTFAGCPDVIFANTPNGSFFQVGAGGGFSTAVGGSFVEFLDLSGCVSDNCTDLADLEVTLTASFEENRVPGCSVDIINEFGVRDACGNFSANTFRFRGTISNAVAPPPIFITCPADVTVECGDDTSPATTGMATATTSCGNLTVTFSDTFASTCGLSGIITRTFTAADACGNDNQCVQLIQIVDNTLPTIVGPADIMIECSQSTDVSVTGNATATDDCAPGGPSPVLASGQLFINELHYDNAGGDLNEGVEIAGLAGTDLSAYTLQPYNGNGGGGYNTTALSGVIPDEGAGYGALFFAISGLQNGAPDGVALCGPAGLIEFISYEGSFTASGGCANGQTSTDIGVSEPGTTLVGQSLQRTGTGTNAGDFTWTGPTMSSPGLLNAGQTINTPGGGGGGGGGTGGPIPTTFTDVRIDGNCPNNFIIERTFTATDACGNTATTLQMITVADTQAPTVGSVPGSLDLTLTQAEVAAFATGACADDLDLTALAASVESDLNAGLIPTLIDDFIAATDNCALTGYSVTAGFGAGSSSCEALVEFSITVLDACGNVSLPFLATLTVTGSGTATLPVVPTVTLLTSTGADCLMPFASVNTGDVFAPGATVLLAGQALTLPALAEIMGCVGPNPTFTVAGTASSVGADPCTTSLSIDFDFASDCASSPVQLFTLTADLTDDTAPVVVAPPTATLSCEQDPTDLSLTGMASASDNCAPAGPAPVVAMGPVFINEFHYDNGGGDVGEFIEVAGIAGTDLSSYTLELVNGGNSAVYDDMTLSGIIPDQGMGYGALAFSYPTNGIQNGAPDGIALCGPAGLIEFLSYEGTITALDGCATGFTSTDVGVEETFQSGYAIGSSLQRVGSGLNGSDFAFIGPVAESPGSINTNQTFLTGGPPTGGMVPTTFTDVIVPGACNGSFTIQRTFEATDACGNMGTALQIITVEDTTPPMFAEAPGSLDVSVTTVELAAASLGSCAVAIDVQDLQFQLSFALLFGQTDFNGLFSFPSASDVCSNTSLAVSSVTIGNVFGQAPCSADLTVTFTATDDCGNTADFPVVITITDNEAPIVRPGVATTLTLECDAPRDTTVTGFPIFDDNCGNSLAPSMSLWINEFHYDNIGGDLNEFIEVAGAAGTDLAGYSLVLYNGNGGATYNTIALSGILPDEGAGGGAIDFQLPSNGLQNGSPDGIALVDAAGMVVEFISYEGVVTATNGPAAGQMSIDVGVSESGATQATESLQRIGAGSSGMSFVFSGPATASPGMLNAGQTYLSSQTVTVSFSESSVPDPSCPNGEVITRTFTADDGCGNTSEFVQTITIVDTQAPEYTLFQADTTIECSTIVGGNTQLSVQAIADALPFPLVSDNCTMGLTPTFIDAFDATLACPTVGVFTRTFDPVDDGCGNILAARTLTITIVDTLAPVFTGLPQAGDYDCTVGLPDLANVTADDCDQNLTFTATEDDDDDNTLGLGFPGQNGVVRVVTQTFTAIDACGLTTSESIVVRLLDTEAPVLVSCPADIGPLVARPDDRVQVDYPMAQFTDNCAFTVSNTNPSGSDFPVGLTTVEIVATDEGGNQAICTFTVEVVKALNIACSTSAISIDDPSDVTRADINFPYAETDCDLCPQGESLPNLDYLGYYQGHRYYVSQPGNQLSWNAAKDYANSLGGRLVQIDDSLENRFLQRELPYDNALIGLVAPSGPGSWVWTTDDNATDYRNWAPGAPANNSTDVYAMLRKSDGLHEDVDASQRAYIIEFSCIDFEVLDVSPTGTYGAGTGCILYAAEDRCGNRDTCHYTFRVSTFPVNYCIPSEPEFDVQVTEEYSITGVRIGAFAETFDIGDDFLHLRDSVEILEDVATSVSLQAETSGADGADFPSYWRVWVDANGDGDFYEDGELIFESFGDASTTGSFVLPSSLAAQTPTRIRVAMSRYAFPEPCGVNPFGDVKDFTLKSDGATTQPRLHLAAALSNRLPVLTTTSQEDPAIVHYLLLRGATTDDLSKIDRWGAVGRDGTEYVYTYDDTDPLLAAYYQAVALDAGGNLLVSSNIVQVTLPVRRGPVGIYPNPAKDRVVITTPQPVGHIPGVVTLYDALGRVVKQGVWPANAEKLELSLPTLPTGAYQLKVTHEDLEPTPLRVIIDQSGSATVPRA